MTRKSKREIEQRLANIEEGPVGEYPVIDTLAELLSSEWVCVDESTNLYQRGKDGEVNHLSEGFERAMEEAFFSDEE